MTWYTLSRSRKKSMRTIRKRVGEAIKQQGGSLDNQLELIQNAADASMIEIGMTNVDRNPGPNYDDMAEVTKSIKQRGNACNMLSRSNSICHKPLKNNIENRYTAGYNK